MQEQDEIKRVKKIALEEKRVVKRKTWEVPILEWITTNDFNETFMRKAITCHFNTGRVKYSPERFAVLVTTVSPHYWELVAKYNRVSGGEPRKPCPVCKIECHLTHYACKFCLKDDQRLFKWRGLVDHWKNKHKYQ